MASDTLDVLKVSSTDNKAVLSGLTPGTVYLVRMFSENAFGRSEASQDVIITTEEEAPMTSPGEVEGVATASDTIKVTWKAPPPSPYQGEIMGYYVGYKDLSSSDPFVYKTVELSKETEGEVFLTNLMRYTKYVITVQAFNSKGPGPSSREIVVQTLEHDPPKSPTLKIASRSATSLELQWNEEVEKYTPVTGYILQHKNDYGEWEQTHIPQQKTRHTVTNLRCGTRYQFTLTAFNNAGKGEPSDVITAKTTGGAPVPPPDKESLLSVNSTFLLVRLSSWKDGGCPILFYVVQYKTQLQKEWILLSNNIVPTQQTIKVSDLNSGTWYNLLMAAHNDAGSAEAEYRFATLTPTGGTVPPPDEYSTGSLTLLTEPAVLVPIVCAIVVVVVITIVVAVVIVLRRKEALSECRSQAYSGSSGGKGENLSMSSYGKVKRNDPSEDSQGEPLYYPTPYATTQLAYAEAANVVAHADTIRRNARQRREHEYDIPHRITQVEDYTSYAKLWTQSRSGEMSRQAESHSGISSNSCLPDSIGWSAIHSRNSKTFKPECYSAVESDIEDLGVLASPTADSAEELSETECDRHQEIWTRTDYHSSGDHIIRQMAHVY